MVNTRWTLGFVITALAIFGASDAHALAPYVHEGPDAACQSKTKSCGGSTAGKAAASDAGSVHRVGSFGLAGIAQDKAPEHVCSTRPGGCASSGKVCPMGSVNKRLAEIVSGPFILAGAVLDDAYLVLTMPYRPSEPIN